MCRIPCDRIRREELVAASVAVLVALLASVSAIARGPADSHQSNSAERLVSDARQAEIDGDSERCYRMLREAVRIAPDLQLARWQLGQMQVDGKWVAVEEAQRRAAANPKQEQYRELRARYGENAEGQLALARWCRKNDLNEEAKFHWSGVLAVEPENEEALRALEMKWSNGQLATHEQIARLKEQQRELKRLEKQWEPRIAKWRKAVAGEDSSQRAETLDEIRALTTSDAILFLEPITLPTTGEEKAIEECRQISPAFVDALTKMQDQVATESLVRHAAFSPMADIQATSIAELKRRPPHDYVPLLLSGLSMPVESSFSVHTTRDGSVHYRHSLYREGQHSDVAINADYSSMQNILPGRRYVYRRALGVFVDRTGDYIRAAARTAIRDGAKFANVASATEARVWNANRSAAHVNSRVMPVLANTTGQDFQTAKQWWDWWQDANEYYSYDHPVQQQYYTGTNTYFYGQPFDTYTENMSCFTKGTPVWTKTGQRPIESVELGDLVLAQNVATGELAYRPVVGRTVRPPSEIINIKLRGEEINATRGHPFWVSGVGWKMAKELANGAFLYGVTGSSRVSSIKPLSQEEAYNLVVSDFNTYFVGEGGLLVHDNTPRTPVRVTVPGVARK